MIITGLKILIKEGTNGEDHDVRRRGYYQAYS